ncbi:tRNA pseudouridine(55) synthase TruB [Clostridium pasteurianum]|uniref:tRNA pseudouridine(55) synthase TruB n=1 Tax=Clostridium pasteurianum TaxID=1501 RepID=UPI002260CEC1|nr:tRNA pseudouridine(55) synthase TruB [Clostridium pasteurianum]UZW12326.1 tRNA pseudouridine(55) synthase TruB [Clostridium pasteurianum]
MDGILNVYKKADMTSFDVVRIVRKLSKIKKVGHTGTLDPLATGVLPICIGKATKLVDYIMDDFKVYDAALKLGVTSDTYDKEGSIIENNCVNIAEKDIINTVKSFQGTIEQIPPMYSALKVNGKRLYDLARKGIEIERKSRQITIFDIVITNISIPYVYFRVKCSKGTYIRSLCNDIGLKLGCGALMWSLERTATGIFTKDNSVNIDRLTEENIKDYLIPMDNSLSKYRELSFDKSLEKLLVNGVIIKNPLLIDHIPKGELFRTYLKNDKFIGIGTKNEAGFKLVKLLI